MSDYHPRPPSPSSLYFLSNIYYCSLHGNTSHHAAKSVIGRAFISSTRVLHRPEHKGQVIGIYQTVAFVHGFICFVFFGKTGFI